MQSLITAEFGFLEDTCTVPVLSKEMASRVVRYAKRRIQESEVECFYGNQDSKMERVEQSQLVLGDCIGEGSFSSVYRIRSLKSKNNLEAEKHVVKVLRSTLLVCPHMFAACAADLYKEGMILTTLNHRNILSAKAWEPSGIDGYASGKHDAFFLVLEKLDITLSEKIRKWRRCSRKISFGKSQQSKYEILRERHSAILQLAEAVKYLHSLGILHRDLKPDNIGFDQDGVLKVFDFDVARIVPDSGCPDDIFKMTKRVGSPRYMSPECANGDHYNLKSDVYSVSLLVWQIFTLKKPYDNLPDECHDECVFVLGIRPRCPAPWPRAMQVFMGTCWSPNPTDRPSMDSVCNTLKQELPQMIAPIPSNGGNKRWTFRRPKTTPVPVCA